MWQGRGATAMRGKKVVKFWRGARQHPRWSMGDVPNSRDRSPLRAARGKRGWSHPVTQLKLLVGIGALGLIVLPIFADAVTIATGGKPSTGGCRVVNVIDGDTVSVHCPSRGLERARLTGFDTPEKFSPRCPSELSRAVAATWALRWMIFKAERLSIVKSGTDRYGRALVFLALDGVPVARRMIDAGHARPYSGGARESWCDT